MDFRAFENDIIQNKWNVFGAEVWDRDRVVDQWGDTVQRHPVYSIVKTITSIAAGMAVDEGKLDLKTPILDYMPQWAQKGMSEEQKLLYRHITIRRLLTMSVSGYPFRLSGESWLKESLQNPIENTEQSEFHYSNVSAYLVGVAVSCAVQEHLYDYLSRKLFEPLQIERPPYTNCPDGYFYGASGMELSVQELRKIGLLLMNEGVYEGHRLLSEQYVKEAVRVQQCNREGGYGYFVWKYREGFSINGKWGQKCFVLPRQGKVITFLSHMEEGSSRMIKSMEKHLLGIKE